MKNLTIISALLLAVVFTLPAKAAYNSFADTNHNHMLSICYAQYEVHGGAFFLGYESGRGELDCYTSGGEHVSIPYESYTVSFGAQGGIWDNRGWMALTGVSLGQNPENWKAASIGVNARAAFGVGVAAKFEVGVDNTAGVFAAVGVEGGVGVNVGSALYVTHYNQVDESDVPDSDQVDMDKWNQMRAQGVAEQGQTMQQQY